MALREGEGELSVRTNKHEGERDRFCIYAMLTRARDAKLNVAQELFYYRRVVKDISNNRRILW